MKKTPAMTDAHCLGCDWTAGPGPAADVDRAAEKHTAKGHPTATITAVLAAIARVVLGAVLLLALLAAALWAWAGPQGWPMVAWLLALCTVIVGTGLVMSALQPKGDRR